MLVKLKWLNALIAVRCTSKPACSPSLKLLKIDAFTMFDLASRNGLSGTSQKGVPNTCSAVFALMMNRTSFLVIGVISDARATFPLLS